MKDRDTEYIDSARKPSVDEVRGPDVSQAGPVADPAVQEHVRWLLAALHETPGTVMGHPFAFYDHEIDPERPNHAVRAAIKTVFDVDVSEDFSRSPMERLRTRHIKGNPETCGERLAFARRQADRQQGTVLELVKKLDPHFDKYKLTDATLSLFEHDHRRPAPRFLVALLDVLEIKPADAMAIIEAAAATPSHKDNSNQVYAGWLIMKNTTGVSSEECYSLWCQWAKSQP